MQEIQFERHARVIHTAEIPAQLIHPHEYVMRNIIADEGLGFCFDGITLLDDGKEFGGAKVMEDYTNKWMQWVEGDDLDTTNEYLLIDDALELLFDRLKQHQLNQYRG